MLWPVPILSARRSEPPIRTEMMRPAIRPKVRTVFLMEVKFSFYANYGFACPKYERGMRGLRTVSLGLWRFPELNAVAVRVGDPGEAAVVGVFAVGIDCDA